MYTFNNEEKYRNYQEFITSEFKAKKYIVKLNRKEKFDLILLFPKAEKGDKIIIDKFVQTEIKE